MKSKLLKQLTCSFAGNAPSYSACAKGGRYPSGIPSRFALGQFRFPLPFAWPHIHSVRFPIARLQVSCFNDKLRKKGFTLIEVLIASVVFVVVMLAVYAAFSTGLFGYRTIEDRLSLYQGGAQILGQLNSDLRNSFPYSENDVKFTGTKDRLSFLTIANVFSSGMFNQDYAFVSYKLENNKLFRLCRLNQQALNAAAEVEFEEMISDIESLFFSYAVLGADGKTLEWKDDWSDSKVMPAAVKINLILKGKVRQDFTRTIFLMG